MNHWLINYGPIGERLGKKWAKDLFLAVAFLHENNISHNNLFNKSILISQDTFEIKLTNFENIYKPEFNQLFHNIIANYGLNPEEDVTFLKTFDDFRPTDIFNLG